MTKKETLKHFGVHTEVSATWVKYHSTRVVDVNDERIILRNGGHLTKTTKLRIQQASDYFGLNIQIWQEKKEWLVNHRGWVYPFYDGMILNRWDWSNIPCRYAITMNDCRSQTVTGTLYNEFALRKDVGFWIIDHLPTGSYAVKYTNKKKALMVVKKLSPLMGTTAVSLKAIDDGAFVNWFREMQSSKVKCRAYRRKV